MYYINNKGFVQKAVMQTDWKASFLCYSPLFGVVYVSEDRHSLCIGPEAVFTVSFCISWVYCFEEDPYVLIACSDECSMQCILLDLCTHVHDYRCVSSCRPRIASLPIESTSRRKLPTGAMRSLRVATTLIASCLLFPGTNAGELFVFELDALTSAQPTNKPHHRVRLDCQRITSLQVASPSIFLVGDECGDVFSILWSLSLVCGSNTSKNTFVIRITSAATTQNFPSSLTPPRSSHCSADSASALPAAPHTSAESAASSAAPASGFRPSACAACSPDPFPSARAACRTPAPFPPTPHAFPVSPLRPSRARRRCRPSAAARTSATGTAGCAAARSAS